MPSGLYTFRVHGRLAGTMLSAFPDFVSDQHDGDTLLTGQVIDCSALYGVVARLESLGLELIEVHRVGDAVPSAPRAGI